MLLIPKGPGFADGETVQLDEADRNRVIGSGGESTVHRLTHPSLGDLAAKIWKNADAFKAAKARRLAWNPPLITPPNLVAAPCAVLQDAEENAVGYLMPLLEPAHWQHVIVCYNQTAAVTAGVADQYGWDDEDTTQRLRTSAAVNLAKVMDDIHNAGYRIGDLKESNVMVSPEGAVALVDCDSWQTPSEDNDRRWNCPMGRPEYTPPEILELLTQDCRQLGCASERPHQTGHACVQRTRQHDAFALAALTFRILMAGEDPFGQHPDMAGRPGHLPREDNDTANRIKSGLFRYGTKHHHCCGPRDEASAQRWQQLPPTVREMMDRALDCTGTVKETGQPLLSTHYMAASSRPEPQEWIRTLRQPENGTSGQRRETTVEATDQEVQQPTETQATIEPSREEIPRRAPAEENVPESQSTTSMELARFGTIAIMIIGIANTCAVATLAIGFSGFAFGMTFSASLCACVAIGIGLSKPNEKGRATQRELIHLMVAAIGIALVTTAVAVQSGQPAIAGGTAAGSCTTLLLALGLTKRIKKAPQPNTPEQQP